MTNYKAAAGTGGSGTVTINTGPGTITVNGGGAADLPTLNYDKSYGILAESNGGNVSVNNQASITVVNNNNTGIGGSGQTTGIFAQTTANGNVDVEDVTVASAITTTNGDGVHAQIVGNGNGTVTVGTLATPFQADITTNTSGHGIEANTDGNGAILGRPGGRGRAIVEHDHDQRHGQRHLRPQRRRGLAVRQRHGCSRDGVIVTNGRRLSA